MRNYFRLGRKTFFFFCDEKIEEVRNAYTMAISNPLVKLFPPALFRPVPFHGPWHLNIVGWPHPDKCDREMLVDRNALVERAFRLHKIGNRDVV